MQRGSDERVASVGPGGEKARYRRIGLLARPVTSHFEAAAIAWSAHLQRTLVTGGTGGLGLLTARWLAQGGAHALVLASRSGAVARDTAAEWA